MIGIGSTGATQKSASPCFDHNFLLRTPISMILYSLESLWNYLQDYAKVLLIWISFECRLNRCLSEGPVQGHRKNRCYWFLHNSSNSAFLWVLYSCFALLNLLNTFLEPKKIHLTNLLVPLIALLYDHQNHSKWHKLWHVRYTTKFVWPLGPGADASLISGRRNYHTNLKFLLG